MRTTLTLDDALRAALAPRPARSAPYRVQVHHAGLDLAGFNKFADELEDEAVMGQAQQG